MILSKDPAFDIDALILMYEQYTLSGKEISDLQEKINKLSTYKNQRASLETIKEEVKEIKAVLLEKTKIHEKKPEFTKEVVTITAPQIEEKTEEKIKDDKSETSTGKSTEDKEDKTTGLSDETSGSSTSSTSECVCK